MSVLLNVPSVKWVFTFAKNVFGDRGLDLVRGYHLAFFQFVCFVYKFFLDLELVL